MPSRYGDDARKGLKLKPLKSPLESQSSSDSSSSSNSSKYMDSPEFDPSTKGDEHHDFDLSIQESITHDFNSALTGRSAIPLSGFKTPQIATGRFSERIRLDNGDENKGNGFNRDDIKGERFVERGVYDAFDNYYDPYPSWSDPDKIPITRQEIELIFIELMEVFKFQLDNTKNMFDFLMRMLDSRASRMDAVQALRSLHADYIGGINSNFKKWYFSAQLDVDDTIGFTNAKKNGQPKKSKIKKGNSDTNDWDNTEPISISLEESEKRWSANMNTLSAQDSIIQISLYLLCWGEANNIRFMPECLCFIFKCCNDYYYGLENIKKTNPNLKPPKSFLDHVITPLYEFYRNESYELVEGRYVTRDRDHSSTIGYDDMNQFFWYRKNLEKIQLNKDTIDKHGNKRKNLISLPPHERYLYLNQVKWSKCFYKTYKERRTWGHAIVNFNRIWIMHCSCFWLYTALNSTSLYTKHYQQQLNNKPPIHVTLSVLAINGSISTFINLVATLLEFFFVPRKWPGANPLLKRFISLLAIFIILTIPTILMLDCLPSYNFIHRLSSPNSKIGLGIGISQFILSIIATTYFTISPLSSLFQKPLTTKDLKTQKFRDYLPNKIFTNSIHRLRGKAALSSYGIWCSVFLLKFLESYFFLTLSLKDPIRELGMIEMKKCVGEAWFGSLLCLHHAKFLLFLMILTDLVLFFLDTYLWYIICNTFHSVCRSIYIGVSIWTPWRNIFSRLPKRFFSKIISVTPDSHSKNKILVSQVWNSIIISMYREHLLSLEHVQRLIYQQVIYTTADNVQTIGLKEPNFFVSQDDHIFEDSMFDSYSEAQRRITFFAQSLSTPIPDPCPVNEMPSFTVLVPHYSEKITLGLREIIKEDEGYSNVTLLEYLKHLHPLEWNCFVEDTKMLAEEDEIESSSNDFSSSDDHSLNNASGAKNLIQNLPYYCIGFKTATPEYVLRTRIWASLRSQTLYRTVSGFMNYSRAIKLLFDVENPNMDSFDNEEFKKLESASIMALIKFRMVVSMQRMNEFSPEEIENRNLLLRAYPELQICYLEEEIIKETGEKRYYSSLIDGGCEILDNGERKPKYRIRLSGNPILGDGKSDNQNHSLIYCRGEYIQLIDANQDNYLEECLKIRSLLAEFEDRSYDQVDPYILQQQKFQEDADAVDKPINSADILEKSFENDPVAIIGTREYIFSENTGILGDIAAGKEQTFGTLFARTLVRIGGKLHYGHPDFLNTIFMTTRGGVSKAQKGLHLNEDIYAGMNVLLRGGRIKHSEYMQCGKGRDLGFGSILNFNTKIGAGMGEQMLSREYYYLGTQLPFDRFLSFYYAHPGFHLNNVFIILSIKLFLIVCVNLAALVHESILCDYNPHVPITDPRKPVGCANLIPVVKWLERSILSIFIVFSVSFVPLCVQELTERGILKMITRITKHFLSLSPLFEVFVCKIYSQSLMNDLSVGGARYIATGRGFATVRVPFYILYSRFATESFYFAATSTLLLIYSSVAMWDLAFLYFWVTITALLICPLLYNPNQYSWNEFFLDYKSYLNWLSSGNNNNDDLEESTWISHVRSMRIQVTGAKRKRLGKPSDKLASDFKKPSFLNIIFSQILTHVGLTFSVFTAYLFANSQNEVRTEIAGNSVLRILVVSFGPIVLNIFFLVTMFFVSVTIGPFVSCCFTSFPSFISGIVHSFSLFNYIFFFEFLWFAENWNFQNAILGLAVSILVQSLFFKIVILLFLSREFKQDVSNRAWWSGKWATSGLGWGILTQPGREFICKIVELSMFTSDFVLGHFILFSQFPILFIPYVDRWHSLLLFWLRPERQIRPQILTTKKRRRRRRIVHFYSFVFLTVAVLFVGVFILPFILNDVLGLDLKGLLPNVFLQIIQPDVVSTSTSKKGLSGYYMGKRKSGVANKRPTV